MTGGEDLPPHRRVYADVAYIWRYTMESKRAANALICIMIAVAWVGLLRVSYLAVHPEHFVTQVAAAAE